MKSLIIILFFSSTLIYAQNWVDFTQQPIRTTQQHAQRVIPVDIDFDGDMNLITSYSLTDEVVLEINNGNSNWQMIPVGSNVVAMFELPADFDGDGDLDIVAVGLFDRILVSIPKSRGGQRESIYPLSLRLHKVCNYFFQLKYLSNVVEVLFAF